MLDQLLGVLEKKDPQQFFAWPVTDNIAPGYSSIIAHPMDFSTMRQKIEENHYDNLQVNKRKYLGEKLKIPKFDRTSWPTSN